MAQRCSPNSNLKAERQLSHATSKTCIRWSTLCLSEKNNLGHASAGPKINPYLKTALKVAKTLRIPNWKVKNQPSHRPWESIGKKKTCKQHATSKRCIRWNHCVDHTAKNKLVQASGPTCTRPRVLYTQATWKVLQHNSWARAFTCLPPSLM